MFKLNKESIYDRLVRTTDTDERIKILQEWDVNEIPNIMDLIISIPGDINPLRSHLYLMNAELFVSSNYIESEALYITDFSKRLDACEDSQTRRMMHVGFVDILERKLLFMKHNHKIEQRLVRESANVIQMYTVLIKMFENDKKALITAGNIYPHLYGYIKDKEHASIMFSEVIANKLTNSLDFKYINDTLLTFLDALVAYGWSADELKWLVYRETEFYIKKALFGLEDVIEIYTIVSYIHNEESNRVGIPKEYFTQLKCIVLDVISDSIGSEIKQDDALYTTIEELQDKISLLRTNYHMVENSINANNIKHILKILDNYAEILNMYNELYNNSDFYKEELVKLNEELGTFLLYLNAEHGIDSSYTNIKTYVEYCHTVIGCVGEVLTIKTASILADIVSYFNNAKNEICGVIRDTTSIPVVSFSKDGFIKDDGTILVYNNVMDEEVRKIRYKYPDTKTILKYIVDPNYSTFTTINALWQIAAIRGNANFDGNGLNSFLEKQIFTDGESFINELYECIFGFSHMDIDVQKFYGNNWSSVLKGVERVTPLYRYLPLDILCDVARITITDNNSVEEITNDIIIEDFDFSDYDFAGTSIEEENSVDMLNPFQILRKVQRGEINLLTTNISKLHKLYSDIIYMLN